MASRTINRYGLESAAKILIAIGLLLVLFSWILGIYYFGITGKITQFIVPFIFTCVLTILLVIIKYRYTIFEKYPYLMNLPSLFYRIKEQKGKDNRGIAFSMIFTVHSLVIAFLGLLSLILTISIGSSIKTGSASAYLHLYLVIVAVLVISVLLQYRRIYLKFVK
jgi:hypothetical protein